MNSPCGFAFIDSPCAKRVSSDKKECSMWSILSSSLHLLVIPVSAGVIGYVTNVLAIKMMFYPIEFTGKKPYFGWQGIIPSKATKIAGDAVDIVLARLISVTELYTRLDPEEVSKELTPVLNELTEEIVEKVVSEAYPKVWETMPKSLKKKTFNKIQKEIPHIIEQIVEDVELHIEEICDVKAIVIDAFVKDKKLLNELFLRCGSEEFKFIGQSGLYFGFLFGVPQMIVWYFVQPWWLLPAAGLLVGYATNWVALKMVFEPVNPVKIGPWEWQGLFLRRQSEVSAEYAEVFAKEILNAKNIINAIIRGPASDRLFMIIQRHLKEAIDDTSGMSKHFVQFVIGTERYIEMKNNICDGLMDSLPNELGRIHTYADEALDLKRELEDGLNSLSPEEFEGILHPVFQEDEWILIVVGALLGMAAGFAQLLMV
ncbi:MAG: DUF445 domain-containing protein [Deltaproteobacteria bacterium]|nr:DUF445 domain-containing protein [Deltaproteobacteria bacterium]MBU49697.1 DUF445 domain-containing protein [Deltaproteobacteria bacterium]|tara:strand:+ start:1395 stop:2678 length:1284 start_codon:yes stop_codon:yes gene_type:complete